MFKKRENQRSRLHLQMISNKLKKESATSKSLLSKNQKLNTKKKQSKKTSEKSREILSHSNLLKMELNNKNINMTRMENNKFDAINNTNLAKLQK